MSDFLEETKWINIRFDNLCDEDIAKLRDFCDKTRPERKITTRYKCLGLSFNAKQDRVDL